MSQGVRYILLAVLLVGSWISIVEYFRLGLQTLVIGSVAGAVVCLLLLVIVPKWQRRRSRHEYLALLDSDQGQIAGKARYRNRRVIHFRDGSVAGEVWGRMKAFRSFDDYRAYVDRR